ncbi:MAG TPA: hypothetical protein VNK70_01000 [Candidatus Paceibacterota bacterium]|nr:hypothetical protein [Candidatus Paceibacterota bacterium]
MMRKLLSAFLLLFFTVPLVTNAFGISPPGLSIDRLVKGSEYEATVFLVRQDSKSDLGVEAAFDFPDKVKSWITIEPNPLVIPAGVQQFPVKVRIRVPENADFGIWSGLITFKTVPVNQKGTAGQQVVIAVGASLSLTLTVGEGVFADFKITSVNILDIKEGESPKIEVTLENTGNVPISPDRATLDLFDKFGQVRLGFGQTENLPETPAFKTKKFIVEFPIDIKLGLGEYWAEAKIYRGETVVGDTKTVFDVVEKKIKWFVWVIGAAILLVISYLARSFLRKRFRR